MESELGRATGQKKPVSLRGRRDVIPPEMATVTRRDDNSSLDVGGADSTVIVKVDTSSGRPLPPPEMESKTVDAEFEIPEMESESPGKESEIPEMESEVQESGQLSGSLDPEQVEWDVGEEEEEEETSEMRDVEDIVDVEQPQKVEGNRKLEEGAEEVSLETTEVSDDNNEEVDDLEDDDSSAAQHPAEDDDNEPEADDDQDFQEIFIVPSAELVAATESSALEPPEAEDGQLKDQEDFQPEVFHEKQDDEECESEGDNSDDEVEPEPGDEPDTDNERKLSLSDELKLEIVDATTQDESDRDKLKFIEDKSDVEKLDVDDQREPNAYCVRPSESEKEVVGFGFAKGADHLPEPTHEAEPDFTCQGDIEQALEPRVELAATEDVIIPVDEAVGDLDETIANGQLPSAVQEDPFRQSHEPLDLLLDVTGGGGPADTQQEESDQTLFDPRDDEHVSFSPRLDGKVKVRPDPGEKAKLNPRTDERGESGPSPKTGETAGENDVTIGISPLPRWAAPLSLAIDVTASDNPEAGSCKSPRLEETVRSEDAGASSRSVSAQIRQIVTKHLSTEDLTEVGTSKHNVRLLQDENLELQRELERLEDLLAATRAEREAVLIKYNALGERMDQFLRQRDAADGSLLEEEAAFKNVLGQNLELRRRLEEQQASFQRKLRTYADGQGQQAQLVQRLQSKVIQYRQKCDDLESSDRARQLRLTDQSRLRSPDVSGIHGYGSGGGGGDGGGDELDDADRPSFHVDSDVDYDPAFIRLEQEQNRCTNLIHVNTLLREQLEAATQANQSLAVDVQKVTQDWSAMREELESKEAEWREEEKSFNDYFMEEHNRLMSLWRDAVSFRREFGDMKSSTEQDLGKIRNEFNKMANELRKACQAAHSHTDGRTAVAERDVSVTIGPYEGVSGEGSTMSPTELWHRIQDLGKAQMEALSERAEMLTRLEELKSLNDQLRRSLDDKERTINSMSANLQDMESAQMQFGNTATLREERDVLFTSLRDLAAQVTGDQGHDVDEREGGSSLLLPDMSGLSGLVASRGGTVGGSALASTLSTIQSALANRQVQIEELTKKLSSSREQLNTSRKHFEDCTEHKRQSEQQIQQLKSQLEISNREKADLARDMDRMRLKFDGLNDEKVQLDVNRQGLVDEIARLNSENDQIRSVSAEIDNSRQLLDEEKEILGLEKEKQQREIEICQKTISTLELRLTSVKEELVQSKETVMKTGLKKDLVKQEKADLEETLKLTEKRCRLLELESVKLKSSESNLRDLLAKLHGDSEALGQERSELTTYAKKLSEEKVLLTGEIAEMEQEKAGLKEELLRLEQEKISLAEEGEAVRDALALAERTNVSLQAEADRHAREKRELGSQLTTEIRKNSSLAEEIVHLTREVEHHRQSINVAVKERELVSKERSDALVRLEAALREMRSQAEALATLRVDKGNLEMSLYQSQQEISSLTAKRSQLELEKNDLTEKRQMQQTQIGLLQKQLEAEKQRREAQKGSFENRLLQAGREQSASLERNRQQHQEITDKFIKEKEILKQRMEASHIEIVQRMTAEKDQGCTKLKAKIETLQRDLEANQRDFQEQWTNCEREKERLKEANRKEKGKLEEHVQNLQKELQALQSNTEREKRETSSRSDQDKTVIVDLQAQLRGLRVQLEDTELTHEKALKDLRNQVQETQHQKNTSQQELVTFRGKLQIAEDAKEHLRKELSETMRKLKHGGEQTQTLQKEVSDVRRQESDVRHECIVLRKSNEEYCSNLKKSESERTELKRSLEENLQKISLIETFGITSSKEIEQLRNTLQEVERSRLDYRKEAYTLRKDLKNLEESLLQKSKEIADLQARVGREEDKDDFNKREIHSLKQKLVETETSREIVRKELANMQRKLTESVDVSSLKERELRTTLDLSRQNERHLDDRKRQLESLFTTATSQIDDLKMQLSISEGKVGALDSQLVKLEGAKKNVEQKLTNIYSSLRRYVGVRLDNDGGRVSFHSPIRRRSPMRGADVDALNVGEPRRRLAFLDRIQSAAEVDPEVIRDSLRDVMQQLTSLEREKEDANVLAKQMTEQLSESQLEREQLHDKLNHLQSSLGSTHQENQKTLSQLASTQQNVLAQQEAISRLQKENSSSSETVDNLEHRIKQLEIEKSQHLIKLTKFSQNETRHETEITTLRANSAELENRFAKTDQAKRTHETELQRLRMSLTDKDTERQVLQDRCETMNRHVQELEDKCSSLQLTVDRLNLSLERSASDESELKGKLQTLNRSLTESASSGWTLQEKIQNLQKALANCENERRASQERLESTKQSLNESKKSNLVLGERVQQLRQEVSNAEDRTKDLEREMRSSEKLLGHHRDGDQENLIQIQRLQQEKQSLQSTVAELQRTLAQLEVERHDFQRWHVLLEKDKSALKQTLDKVERERLMTSELASRTNRERSYLDNSLVSLDKENKDLLLRFQTLEAQTTDRERHHAQQLLNLTTRHRQEKDIEIDRLRNAKIQAERTLELRERAHRQRVLGLEQQIQMLRDQLNQEIRKRQMYIQKSAQTGEDVKDLRDALDKSLKNVSHNSTFNSLLLEHETRMLDTAVDRHLTVADRLSPYRERSRTVSPRRLAATTSTPLPPRSAIHLPFKNRGSSDSLKRQ